VAGEAPPAGAGTITLGIVAAPGLPGELAEELAAELPAVLGERVSSGVAWEVAVVVDERAGEPGSTGIDVIEAARDRMLREGWSLAVCLTDLPLRIDGRPLVADASATHGVAVVSLPALGAVHLRRRVGDAIVRLMDGLVGERMPGATDGGGDEDREARRRRVGRRLVEVAAPVRRVVPDDEDVDIRYVAAVMRGNLRLLAGMVRANRPWRLVAGLSRALALALGAAALTLVQSDVWRIAAALGPLRLTVLTVVSVTATAISLIVAHELWERPVQGGAREQVVLFNVATALTVALGIACLYVGLFALSLAAAGLVLTGGLLADELGRSVRLRDYVDLAWLLSSLATVGSALGAGLESDAAVRQAAYGYHPDEA
jgi:hypothetical protein